VDERDYDPPRRLLALPSWQLNRAAQAANELTGAAFSEAGVRRHHYAVLLALREAGPASQAALGRRLGIDRKDMAAVVAELERDGWAARRRDADDRRRNVVSVTAEGERALARIDDGVAAAQEPLLAPLTAAERQELVRLLERVAAYRDGRSAQD
jgi:MarR family transcriptional regulator, lower aerobic nicotinate degradation pathway regulator